VKFEKYQKVRRLGDSSTKGILNGIVSVFSKVDGTNASIWMDNGELKAGSRNRTLTLEKDNGGFYAHVLDNENIIKFMKAHSEYRLFGEWLIPHSLKTYKESAWRKLYIFDVMDSTGEYIPYNHYKDMLEEYGVNYIPPIVEIKGANKESLYRTLEKNNFLIKDGEGIGEGVVIKNYDYVNKYGEIIWAKIVTSEFKEKHTKTMGAPTITVSSVIEESIVEDFVTSAFVEKEYAKIVNNNDGWESKYIGEFLNKIWYELINEEMWNILDKYKTPEIDFSLLRRMTINKIKNVKRELF
jgi:hypothetical protein